VPHPVKGEGVVVFVVLKPGVEPADSLRERSRTRWWRSWGAAAAGRGPLRARSAPHPQRQNHAAGDRAKHLGATDLGDLSGLENPSAIEEIAQAR